MSIEKGEHCSEFSRREARETWEIPAFPIAGLLEEELFWTNLQNQTLRYHKDNNFYEQDKRWELEFFHHIMKDWLHA